MAGSRHRDTQVEGPISPIPTRQALGLGLTVAVIVQFLLLIGMGFHEPGGSDAPPTVLAAGAYYVANAMVLGIVVHALELCRSRMAGRVTIRSVMLLVAVCAVNLLFLRHWVNFDADVRRTVSIEYVRGWNVAAVVVPLEFLLSVFNTTFCLLALSRTSATGADGSCEKPAADEL